jgi:hypothetical protein
MRCWRGMEMIDWTEHVKNEEVFHRAKEERITCFVIYCIGTAFLKHII